MGYVGIKLSAKEVDRLYCWIKAKTRLIKLSLDKCSEQPPARVSKKCSQHIKTRLIQKFENIITELKQTGSLLIYKLGVINLIKNQ